jgi:5'-nucleotidase
MRPILPTRRALLSTGLAAGLALPALRRAVAEGPLRLTLLHLNDFHSKHDGVEARGAACRAELPCLGGSPRLASALAAGRAAALAEGRAVLQMDAGDQFTGSLYFTANRGLVEAAVQRATGCQAMALGNHEFDLGPGALAAYAAAVGFPLLSANLDASGEPLLADRIRGHIVFRRGEARIGVIGVTTEDTPRMASPGPSLRFTSPEAAVLRGIAAIQAEGPATILVLSHLGLPEDLRLAATVPGIDAIIGGHSHLLLANGLPGAIGPHPLLVEGPDRSVRIVQAGAHGRWLGRLDLDLAPDGRIAHHGGEVREIGPDLPEDPAVAAILAGYAAPLAELRARAVGPVPLLLSNEECRRAECALGNMVAEALLAATPQAEAALVNGGGLRASLLPGAASWGDVLAVLPFGNTLAALDLRGADLRAALEIGLSRAEQNGGGFPQVAGLRLTWRPDAPAGQRIRALEIRQGDAFRPVEPDRVYHLVTHNFLRQGGDGYAPLRDRALGAYDNGAALEEVVVDFLAKGRAGAVRLDGRIAPVD